MIAGPGASVEPFSPELPRIAARLFNVALLIAPGPVSALVSGLAPRLGVLPMWAATSFAALDRRGERGGEKPYTVADGVATIGVRGELANRGSRINAQSGVMSYDVMQRALRQAEADPTVMGILLDIDSPGGEAAGAMETADVVRSVAAKKPVVAYVNGLAASAAYAIAAGASEIVAAPSATLGSIGVVWLHVDRSQAIAQAGLKPTLIHAGARKIDGNALGPLDAAARAAIQRQIDDVYGLFITSVGKHRPRLGKDGARRTDAAIYFGQKAVDAGLADRVGTMSDALQAIRRRTPAVTGRVAASAPAATPSAMVEAPAPRPPARADAPPVGGEMRARALAFAREAGRAGDEGLIADYIDGALAERARVAAILDCEAAKGREPLAMRLALDTDLTVEAAIAALSIAPRSPVAGRQTRPQPERVYRTMGEANEAIRRGEGCFKIALK